MDNLAEKESIVNEYEEELVEYEAEYSENNNQSLDQELSAALEQKEKSTAATLLQQEVLLQRLYEKNSLTGLGQKVAAFLSESTGTTLEQEVTKESFYILIKQFIDENGKSISSLIPTSTDPKNYTVSKEDVNPKHQYEVLKSKLNEPDTNQYATSPTHPADSVQSRISVEHRLYIGEYLELGGQITRLSKKLFNNT